MLIFVAAEYEGNMSQTHLVRFYPVGNGDTSQIIAIDGKRYLFDYCHRKQDKDDKC